MAVLQSFNIVLEKEGKKEKKMVIRTRGIRSWSPSQVRTTHGEQGLTLLSERIMLLSLWYSDYAEGFFFFLLQFLR